MAGRLSVCDLGLVGYGEALALQRAIRDRRIEGSVGDTLLLLEHPPTVSLGRRTKPGDLLVDREGLRRLGFGVAEVERGGRATYHGPGQLVGYAIISLKERGLSVPRFVALLEQTGIDYLAGLGIVAGRRDGLTGVWTNGRKIGAIGVHLRRWVSLHGFALNADPDLRHYDAIVPCGIADAEATSVRRELGHAPPMSEVKRGVTASFAQAFGYAGADCVALESLPAQPAA